MKSVESAAKVAVLFSLVMFCDFYSTVGLVTKEGQEDFICQFDCFDEGREFRYNEILAKVGQCAEKVPSRFIGIINGLRRLAVLDKMRKLNHPELVQEDDSQVLKSGLFFKLLVWSPEALLNLQGYAGMVSVANVALASRILTSPADSGRLDALKEHLAFILRPRAYSTGMAATFVFQLSARLVEILVSAVKIELEVANLLARADFYQFCQQERCVELFDQLPESDCLL